MAGKKIPLLVKRARTNRVRLRWERIAHRRVR